MNTYHIEMLLTSSSTKLSKNDNNVITLPKSIIELRMYILNKLQDLDGIHIYRLNIIEDKEKAP